MNVSSIICTSPYLRTTHYTQPVANELFAALEHLGVKHMELNNTKDFWCRDYMPIPLFNDGLGHYVKYEYKPDYLWAKNSYHQYITSQSDACQGLDIHISSLMSVILDGGNYVRCGDKVIMTDKILYENPQWSANGLLNNLSKQLMAEIVLIPWDMDDPCGHADGIVAPLNEGKLLLNNYCQTAKGKKKAYYKKLVKILNAHFELTELIYECKLEKDSWCYLNYLEEPGIIFLPCLSLGANCDNDQAAIDKFKQIFPKHHIAPIFSKPLIERGGALHCVTWQYYKTF